ncbi:MAG: GMC family oxidoreductase [Flavobacteriales bacterium]|nr:GMC family oxidoreductase [Flavobacteriales bacterium]
MGNKITNTLTTKTNNYFDAIVVGSGISGGWAAKELSENNLETLVLERGENVDHIKDYSTALMNPWDFKYRNNMSKSDLSEQPIQSSHCNAGNKHFFVNDKENPYIQEKTFKWIRGYQVGGRSLTWGRQCYRFSDLDFEANKNDGHGVDWPIRYKDLSPWYNYVESYIGVSGEKEGLSQLPDGIFLPPIGFNTIERHLKDNASSYSRTLKVIQSRVANLTENKNGRLKCQYRNLCSRGCPYTAYFSSNGVTLKDAEQTGKMTLRVNSIVKEVIFDSEKNKAIGVRIIDAKTKQEKEYYAEIIFLNASTIATAAILLNSTSERFPNGLGNSSMQLGHNLMDHVVTSGVTADHNGYLDKYYYGRSPGSIYIPRFQNLQGQKKEKNFLRGYGLQGKGERKNWSNRELVGIGSDLKDQLCSPGKWGIWLGGRGETLPYYSNHMSLDKNKFDSWGMPLIKVDFEFKANELAMIDHMNKSAEDLLAKTGFSNINTYRSNPIAGSAVHEMGTARMGRDSRTSVLNENNQMHDVKNVFITDGSCMTSSGSQNPSLTYMALTARACNFAVKEFKAGRL